MDHKIGEKIKALRLQHNLTQSQLAEKIGADQPLLARWENGKKIPSLPTLIKIAKNFNISLDTLAFNDRDLQTLISKDKTLISKLKNFEKLSEQDKQTVANLIDSLAAKS